MPNDTADELRRISVTNSVWIALGGPSGLVSRIPIQQAVEEGERVWREQHIKTLDENDNASKE